MSSCRLGGVVLSSSRDDAKAPAVCRIRVGFTPNFVVSEYASAEGNWSSIRRVGAVRQYGCILVPMWNVVKHWICVRSRSEVDVVECVILLSYWMAFRS